MQSIFLISLSWPEATNTFLFNIWAELCGLRSPNQNISLFITQLLLHLGMPPMPCCLCWLILVTLSQVTALGMKGRNSEVLGKGLSPVVPSSWFVFWDNEGFSFSFLPCSLLPIPCPKVGEKRS